MKKRSLFSVTAAIALGATAIFNQPSSAQPSSARATASVSCEIRNSTPTTIVRRSGGSGEAVPIFHWRDNFLPSSVNPPQLCENVSKKLQSYFDAGGQDLYVDITYIAGIPAVCIEEVPGTCSLLLFTLPPRDDRDAPLSEINLVLDSLIDDRLKYSGSTYTRGDQSTRFSLGLWRILRLML